MRTLGSELEAKAADVFLRSWYKQVNEIRKHTMVLMRYGREYRKG